MRTLCTALVLALGFTMLVVTEAQHRKFYPDDPLLVDDDTIDVPDEPAEIDLSDMFDRFGHIVVDLGVSDAHRGGERQHPGRGAGQLLVHQPPWDAPDVTRGDHPGAEHR